jgi:NAD(P)-dependent dehydrogenase (short-subunit alcohol dehydrogenase family)
VRSYVVTGGGRGVGRALAERLLADGGAVVAVELDPAALTWTEDHPAGDRVAGVAGDATDEAICGRAADLAEAAGPLAGWVNNAALFRDASLHEAAPPPSAGSWPPAAAGRSSTSPPTRPSGPCAAPSPTPPPRRPSRA